jgi:1,4-alpha-glucan branching enzyme
MERLINLHSTPLERRVPLVVDAPQAEEVILTGDFTRWSREGIRLRRSSDGQWGTVLRIPPGEYEYRLVIDGQWADHLDAPKRVPNPFGSFNCVLVVSRR